MTLAKLFTYIGVICITLALILLWQRNNPKRLAFVEAPIGKSRDLSQNNIPVRLIIKDLRIDLPIIPAKIRGKDWETTSAGTSWLDQSPIPGEKGNSILYGHNWANILGRLVEIKPKSKIQITLRDGSKLTFSVESTEAVSPKNVSVLSPTSDFRITLYTCIGLFDEKRFVVVARL